MCGSTGAQNEIQAAQIATMNQANQEMAQVFGDASAVYNEISSANAPIVAAGINQKGFSAAEDQDLQSLNTTLGGESYNNVLKATKEQEAAEGGVQLPNGVTIQQQTGLATQAAQNIATGSQNIETQNYATGRANYLAAEQALAGSTNPFNTSSGATNAATGAGTAAANTANQIAQQDNSWMSAVSGVLGAAVGGITSGGMSNLGKGVPFFGKG